MKKGFNKIWPLLLVAIWAVSVQAWEFSGNIAAELQWYPEDAQYPDQQDKSVSLSFQPKLTYGWNNGDDVFSTELFMRADQGDENRQHVNIRELKWLHLSGDDEWRVGVDTVFWGVTESQHLVDVINSIDRVEDIDGEDKLGQSMVHYTTIQDWGVFHVFILPGLHESEFHSKEGRLRYPLPVDDSQASYESDDKAYHVDYALRYTQTFGDVELGLSYFKGTNRDPELNIGFDSNGQLVLVPYYAQMAQFGIDLQAIVEDWIWKWELIHRDQDSGSYIATTAGFEYTFYGILDSATDMGTLLEYSYDDRSKEEDGVFNNDLFAGLRFAFNDVQSSEILAGFIVDTENQSKTLRIEASRRLGDSWKLSGEMQVFTDIDAADPLQAYERDDYLLVELAKYF
jgi:hypothetical protein